MKVLGIAIEANKAIFAPLEKNASGEFFEILNTPKKLELKDHLDSAEVRSFQEDLHTFLGEQSFCKVGIITRGTKGRFAASPISFKIEGLIQSFPNLTIDFVAPATLRSFYKKNENPIEPKYSYQKDACDLAFYLLS
ncbi:MAG: DUF3010 family protein [Crocinitomicaceae bacterium]